MSKTEIKLDWPILGNGHIVDFLAKSLAKEELAGTYIFAGPDKLGKATVANYFAYSLLCQNRGKSKVLPCGDCPACRQHQTGKSEADEDNLASVHADLYAIKKEKDKKEIGIDQVRDFIRSLGMSSFLNSYKVGIIKHAESLSDKAANALLKTLEEPKEKVIIILVTADLAALPETIISRSQVLKFHPVKADLIYEYLIEKHGASRSAAKNLSRLSLGRPALAVKFLEDKDFYDKYLKRADAFLKFFGSAYQERFRLIGELVGAKPGGPETAKVARRVIGVWRGLVRDMILLHFGQGDLVQHEISLAELERRERTAGLPALLDLATALDRAETYLDANVSPKLVLENIAANINP